MIPDASGFGPAPRVREAALRATTLVSETLASAGVTHFQLVWTPGVLKGGGDAARAVRLDRLGCAAVLAPAAAGPAPISFGLFMVRGSP